MQNTNSTPVSGIISSLQKEKTAVKPQPPVTVKTLAHALPGMRIHETVWQKIKAFLLSIFADRKHKLQKADNKIMFTAITEQKRMPHRAEQAKVSVGAAVHVQPANPHSSAVHDTLRKVAEQQFHTMDVSQASRN